MQLGAKREIKTKLQRGVERSTWAIVEVLVEVELRLSSRQKGRKRRRKAKARAACAELHVEADPSVLSPWAEEWTKESTPWLSQNEEGKACHTWTSKKQLAMCSCSQEEGVRPCMPRRNEATLEPCMKHTKHNERRSASYPLPCAKKTKQRKRATWARCNHWIEEESHVYSMKRRRKLAHIAMQEKGANQAHHEEKRR